MNDFPHVVPLKFSYQIASGNSADGAVAWCVSELGMSGKTDLWRTRLGKFTGPSATTTIFFSFKDLDTAVQFKMKFG